MSAALWDARLTLLDDDDDDDDDNDHGPDPIVDDENKNDNDEDDNDDQAPFTQQHTDTGRLRLLGPRAVRRLADDHRRRRALYGNLDLEVATYGILGLGGKASGGRSSSSSNNATGLSSSHTTLSTINESLVRAEGQAVASALGNGLDRLMDQCRRTGSYGNGKDDATAYTAFLSGGRGKGLGGSAFSDFDTHDPDHDDPLASGGGPADAALALRLREARQRYLYATTAATSHLPGGLGLTNNHPTHTHNPMALLPSVGGVNRTGLRPPGATAALPLLPPNSNNNNNNNNTSKAVTGSATAHNPNATANLTTPHNEWLQPLLQRLPPVGIGTGGGRWGHGPYHHHSHRPKPPPHLVEMALAYLASTPLPPPPHTHKRKGAHMGMMGEDDDDDDSDDGTHHGTAHSTITTSHDGTGTKHAGGGAYGNQYRARMRRRLTSPDDTAAVTATTQA